MTTMQSTNNPRNTPLNPSTNPSRQTSPQSRPANSNTSNIPQDRIARRAYEIWEASGRPEGQSEQHWQQAEAELRRS